jgi:hypothetical protein
MATGGRGGKLWEHGCSSGDSHASTPTPSRLREFKKINRIERIGTISNININNYNYLLRNVFFHSP